MTVTRVRHPEKLGDRLGDPDSCDASFVVLFDGWVDDLVRLHSSIVSNVGSHDWELVVVDNPVDEAASERIASLDRVVHVPLVQKMGFGGGRNLGLRLSSGRISIVVDTSVELTGDALGSISHLLGEEHVGLVGRWGVVTPNGFDFEEVDEARDVDGVEAYLMAARRPVWGKVGLFDAKFKWYRNADVDLSFRFRGAGYRTVIDPAIPVVRHEHRLWESTPTDEREQLSRKNFWRFRDHWGEREDLLVSKGQSSTA